MSSKKTFTEFLVDQGLLSQEQMVDVLLRQTNAMPTVAQIVRDNGLLTPQQIFEVFMYQMKAPGVCDFSGACHELGLWTAEVAKGIAEVQASLRLPIVEILVESKLVDKTKVVSLLDHYLSENGANAGAAVVVVAATATEAVSALGTESVAEASDEISHFHEYYSQELHTEVLSMAHRWAHDDAAGSATLVDKLHGLVGAARFSKLPTLEALFKEAESSVRGARDLPAVGDVLMNALRDDVIFNVEKAWSLRASMQTQNPHEAAS